MRALELRIDDRWRVLLAAVVALISIPLLLLIDFGSTVGAEDDSVTVQPSPSSAAPVAAPDTTATPPAEAPLETTSTPPNTVASVVVTPESTTPPATNPPATNPPATDPPATEPPSTDAPPTSVPETSPPTTEERLVIEAPPETQPPTTEPPTTEPPTTQPPGESPRAAVTPIPGQDGDPTADQWWRLRECESNNNYQSTNPSGKFRGAYQFSQATWDWVANKFHPSLAGEDPAAALPANQDAMALGLIRMQSPRAAWPECSQVAGIS